jgi:hypothetical protein
MVRYAPAVARSAKVDEEDELLAEMSEGEGASSESDELEEAAAATW